MFIFFPNFLFTVLAFSIFICIFYKLMRKFFKEKFDAFLFTLFPNTFLLVVLLVVPVKTKTIHIEKPKVDTLNTGEIYIRYQDEQLTIENIDKINNFEKYEVYLFREFSCLGIQGEKKLILKKENK